MTTKKKKKEEEKDMMAEIKKMEAEKRAKAMESQPKKAEQKMSFDTWWMRRNKHIPKAHRKEIIRADFKGRGMEGEALMSDFDKALEKYGLKLNK